MITFDPAKDELNVEKHGVSLSRGEEMDLEDALIVSSDRRGETRFTAYGLIDERLFAMAFTFRGADVRVISLRRANRSERKRYDEA